jgi:hypothetical protein
MKEHCLTTTYQELSAMDKQRLKQSPRSSCNSNSNNNTKKRRAGATAEPTASTPPSEKRQQTTNFAAADEEEEEELPVVALHTPAALAATATAVAVGGTHIHNNLTCAVCAQQARTRFCRKCGPSVPLHGPKMKQGPPEVSTS